MIGSSGKMDGNIKQMLRKTENGIKTGRSYSKKMAMVGGGFNAYKSPKESKTDYIF